MVFGFPGGVAPWVLLVVLVACLVCDLVARGFGGVSLVILVGDCGYFG